MKKLITMVFAGLTILSLVACSKNIGSNENIAGQSSNGKIEERTKFVVGFDAAFPPYGYLDEQTGAYVGFDLSLAEEVCKRKGWELVKNPIEWTAKDMELQSGAIDCIWSGFTMTGREQAYAWTTPYVDNSQVFVVAADSGITTTKIWRIRLCLSNQILALCIV